MQGMDEMKKTYLFIFLFVTVSKIFCGFIMFERGEIFVPDIAEKALIEIVRCDVEHILSTNTFSISEIMFDVEREGQILKGNIAFYPIHNNSVEEVSSYGYHLSKEKKDATLPILWKGHAKQIVDYISSLLKNELGQLDIVELKIVWFGVNGKGRFYRGYISVKPDGTVSTNDFGTL